MTRVLWLFSALVVLTGCDTTYEFPGHSQSEVDQIVAQCREDATKNSSGEAIKDEVLDRCYAEHGGRAKQPF